MASHEFLTVLQDYHKLNDQLAKAQKVKKEAFKVFDHSACGCSLNKMMSVYEGAWQELYELDGLFLKQCHDDIRDAFYKVTNAWINRTEFENYLSTARKEVEAYIASLSTNVEKKQKELLELYDKRFRSKELSFIYTAPAVKDDFISFILS